MLPKKERITRVAFDTHFKKGRRVHGEYLTVVVSSAPTFHSSVVVGKKVYKDAVSRNRLRRRLYAIVRAHKPPLLPKGVYIVLAKQSCSKAPYLSVKSELFDLIQTVSQAK